MNAEQDEQVRRQMQAIGAAVKNLIPQGFGFFVMVFPFGDVKGRANYVSNGRRADVLNSMKEFIIKAGAGEEWMKHLP